jgi:hypothetical protein
MLRSKQVGFLRGQAFACFERYLMVAPTDRGPLGKCSHTNYFTSAIESTQLLI